MVICKPAELSGDRLMTADTPMLIGSQTKSFTALAVMQLVDGFFPDVALLELRLWVK